MSPALYNTSVQDLFLSSTLYNSSVFRADFCPLPSTTPVFRTYFCPPPCTTLLWTSSTLYNSSVALHPGRAKFSLSPIFTFTDIFLNFVHSIYFFGGKEPPSLSLPFFPNALKPPKAFFIASFFKNAFIRAQKHRQEEFRNACKVTGKVLVCEDSSQRLQV